LAYGTILSGWALAEQGRAAEGIERMQQGLSAYRATGAEHWRTHFLALLADAYARAGQAGTGLKTLAEALAVVDRTEERVHEAELYRLKGELTLLQPSREGEEAGGRDEAEVCFLKAIAIAGRQGARSLELRTVMSLSRLWRQQGRQVDARQMLTETYGWFTEGFDTADLQEARALLAELH
jgi:predicted ATPase